MEEYNWNLISKVSIPIGILVAAVFYLDTSNFWKYFSMVAGIILAGSIVYMKDRKKSNIFTASAIVFLAALIVKMSRDIGII